jgi:hypothetical protein
VSGFCLLVWIGLLHLKMSATEQYANIKCCVCFTNLLQRLQIQITNAKKHVVKAAIKKNAGLKVALTF